MGWLQRLFGRGTESHGYRLARARSLHGKPVRYVTERREDNEDVIGRGGAIAVHGDTLIVDSSGDRIFVCPIDELEVSDLMSGDGVILRGPDRLSDGRERTVTVHFVYYRK